MASVTVQSLLNAATYDSYTVTIASDTVNDLKADIASATGVDVAWFDLVLNEQILTGTDTLQSAGVEDGDSLRTANKINQLATKELRQKSKLDLAAIKRAADGNPRSTYDITELPTQYNDNSIIDNPNPVGLTLGRPWITTPVAETLSTFTVVQTTDWTAPAGATTVEYLVVGGGGGAGNAYDNAGGGGGGAGMVLTGNLAVTPGTTYTVIVGDGGVGGADARANNPGTAGSNSVFATITALGGGQGLGSRTGGAVGAAQISNTTAPTGGSGSGGGNGGKGGGGAGGSGGANSGATGGSGGAGTVSSITGSSVTYGLGGAGGGAGAPTTNGANGTANRGNGGQGGKSGSSDSAKGGDGGSGIVVLKYLAPAEFTFYEAFGTTAAISTIQYVSGNKIYAESSTYDVPDFQNARIIVNDIEIVNTATRGHTLAVLDSYGDTVSITNFDTYIDPANVTALAAALNAVASGNIVVLVVYDASAVDAGVRSAINTGYGSTNSNTWTASRVSHIFIGEKV